MTILGISAFYHDAAAAILEDGKVVAAAQEERFTRIKNDPAFPVNAIKFCLEFAGRSLNDIDAVAFYDKPLLKFERLLETYYTFAPRGLASFMKSMPVWIREKLFLKKMIREGLDGIEKTGRKKIKLLFPEHHLSHAASAFYASPYQRAAILTIDGVGEWATATIGLGEGNKITTLRQLNFPHSVGLLYSAFTYYCGFAVNEGEYKLMGLAPYGNRESLEVAHFVKLIREHIVTVKEDGSIFLHQRYFNYAVGFTMAAEKEWEKLFGFPKRAADTSPDQNHCRLAMAIQIVTEEIVLRMGREAKRLTNADYLCMAGGVALNGVAVGKLDAASVFKEIYVQPAAGDAGGALGAAYAAEYIYFNKEREIVRGHDPLNGAYLGNSFSDLDIETTARKYKAVFEPKGEEELVEDVAELIEQGKVVGWHQGRMEFGPRALGARSILADARDPEMQQKLNRAIKFRESFRPFAPIVPVEDAADYFDHAGGSPYMSFVKPVKPGAGLPAVTHVDQSARLQTVDRRTNLRLWKLLQAFKRRTGCSVMVNTSMNVGGEPIVNTPEQAYILFMNTGMDALAIGNFIAHKSAQPPWKKTNPIDEDRTA